MPERVKTTWNSWRLPRTKAVIDPVSGLFNRRYFQARLEEELHRAVRQLTSVGLLMVDLDGFKSINDRFGHVAGDMVIRDISITTYPAYESTDVEVARRSLEMFRAGAGPRVDWLRLRLQCR